MSNYKSYTRHPYTKEWSMATWLDDHYGPHRYGVQFENGDTFSPETTELEVKSFDDRMYEEYCEWMKELIEDSRKPDFEDFAFLGKKYQELRESYNF